MKVLRKGKPHVTSKEKYKHIIGNNGEDIQEYSSSSSYSKTFAEPGIMRMMKKELAKREERRNKETKKNN
jgi:hypothetical protein